VDLDHFTRPPLDDSVADLLERPAWHAEAACRGMGPSEFFLEGHGVAYRFARTVCADCPVKAECAEAGRNEAFGMWGGMSERDRRKAKGWKLQNNGARLRLAQ
jgi:WhiB family redox-sensing transcriptional regulator